MRRLLALVPVLALALLAASLTPTAAQPRAPGGLAAGDLYLALGDSLTTGTEAAANNDGKPGYPNYIRDKITATTAISYTLLGVSGESTTSMLAPNDQLDQAQTAITNAQAQNQRLGLITLSIGGNDIVDVFRGGDRTVTDTLALMRTNLSLILDELITASAAGTSKPPQIMLMNYYNPYPGVTIGVAPFTISLPPGQEPIVTDRDLPKFNAMLNEIAAERCIPVVDAFRVVKGKEAPYLFVDIAQALANPFLLEQYLDYHPREFGHIALADAFFAEIDQLGCRAYLPFSRR